MQGKTADFRLMDAKSRWALPAPLVNADAAFSRALASEQRRLMQFYRASPHAYDGDRAAWGRDIQAMLKQDSANPYYRWFVGQ